MNNKVKLIVNDEEMFQKIEDIAYEDGNTNISILHSEDDGFTISIFYKATKTMRYYDVKDGKLILSSTEDVISGKSIN